MAGQNGTGPIGQGARTGRGMGRCTPETPTSNNQAGFGQGRGQRGSGQGRGRAMGFMNRLGSTFEFGNQMNNINNEDLKNHISDLEAELKNAKETLKNLSDSENKTDDK